MITPMKNKYIVRSRILREEISFNFIVCFYFAYACSFARSMDIESSKIAEICKISQNSLCKIFKHIRILMLKECEKISKMQGEIEIDESYFGAKRVRGKRGRGAGNKTPVFLLRYTRNCKQKVC